MCVQGLLVDSLVESSRLGESKEREKPGEDGDANTCGIFERKYERKVANWKTVQ